MVKFITGRSPLTEWDTFVKNAKSMGVDRILTIRQAQYDRYLKALKK